MTKAVVVGSINIDFVVNTPRIPKAGETISGTDFKLVSGGKGANQAVAASRLGAPTQMIGYVGQDVFGELSLSTLKAENVDCSLIKTSSTQPTGTAVIMVEENGENRIVIVSGANGEVTFSNFPEIENIIKQADFLVLQFEIPQQTTLQLIEVAAKYQTKVVFNPAPAYQFEKKYFNQIDYFIVNETEAELYGNLPVFDVVSAYQAAQQLINLGVKNVIVTLGAQGAIFKNNSTQFHIPGIEVEVVDTTAAGDTFVGGLVSALLENKSMKDSMQFAISASALAVTKHGAQPSIPTKSEAINFMQLKFQE